MNATSNRASEYRARAAEARAAALAATNEKASESLRDDAEIFDRMAEWEDQDNPPPSIVDRAVVRKWMPPIDDGRELVRKQASDD